jgi:hypothetical protein
MGIIYLLRSCVNQWEEEKYFILYRYWLKSKGTLPTYIYKTQDKEHN